MITEKDANQDDVIKEKNVLDSDKVVEMTELTDKRVREVRAEFSKDIDNLHTYVESLKKDFLAFFGLFASFMAFLSIEIQIFKSRDDWRELLGVTSLTVAFIGYFALLLMSVMQTDKSLVSLNDIKKVSFNWQKTWPFLFTLLFAITGVILLTYSGTTTTKKALELLEKKITVEIEQNKHQKVTFDSLMQNHTQLHSELERLENETNRLRIEIYRLDSFHARMIGIMPTIERYKK